MSATAKLPGIFSISGRLWLILLMVQLSNMLFGMTITNHMVQQHNKAGIMADNGNIREITSIINDRL